MVVFNVSTRYRDRGQVPPCDILRCCTLRHSHVATLLQNETISYCEFAEREFSNCDIFSLWDLSHFGTLFHNENVHNATTSHYGICCTLRQRLNMRIVAYCDNTIVEPHHWSYFLIPRDVNAFLQITVSYWNH